MTISNESQPILSFFLPAQAYLIQGDVQSDHHTSNGLHGRISTAVQQARPIECPSMDSSNSSTNCHHILQTPPAQQRKCIMFGMCPKRIS
jgi:hypothetical protein